MSLLIRNARLLTLAGPNRPRRGKELGELGVIPAGDVLVADGKITAVGPKVEAPADTEVIEAQGRVLMPGFVDCHTHACWAGDRLGEWELKRRGVPYLEILKKGGGIHATVRAVREATKKQLAAHLKTRLDAMLRDGTTTVEIKSGYGLETEAELKMLRAIVRAGNEWPGTIVPTALLGHAFEGDLDEYARMVVKEMLPAVSKANSPTSPWTPSARKAPGRSRPACAFLRKPRSIIRFASMPTSSPRLGWCPRRSGSARAASTTSRPRPRRT